MKDSDTQWSNKRFYLLILIIMVAGCSQGLLIPLITTLFEEQGVSSTVNGLSAAALYVGILVMVPFCGKITRRKGYRSAIIIGLSITTGCVILFPFLKGVWLWSLLRFFVGVGDSLLHYATQLWITSTVLLVERGKRTAQYGLAYCLGFGIGPMGINLLDVGFFTPFVLLAMLLIVTLFLCLRLPQGTFLQKEKTDKKKNHFGMIKQIYRIAFIALIPSFIYGFVEASIAGNFPIYGLREEMPKAWISMLITSFIWGGILSTVPLGILADRYGRKNILIGIGLIGSVAMFLVPFVMPNVYLLLPLFILIGSLIGPLYTIGLAYMADLVSDDKLPQSNAIVSTHFSLGCLLGPYLGGIFIQYFGGSCLFYFMTLFLFTFVIISMTYRVSPIKQRGPIEVSS